MVLAVILYVGCNRSQEKPAASDPVSELKQVMQLFAAKSAATNYSFDVTKTDSIVSPYAGTVEYFIHLKGGGNLPSDDYDLRFRPSFTYQEKKWVLKKICCQGIFASQTTPDRFTRWCDDEGEPDASERVLSKDEHFRYTVAKKYRLLPRMMEERAQWGDALGVVYSK